MLGPGLMAQECHTILSRLIAEHPKCRSRVVLIGIGAALDLFRPFVDHDRVFYVSRGDLPDPEIRAIVIAAARALHLPPERSDVALLKTAGMRDEIIEYCARLCRQKDWTSASRLMEEALRHVASRSACLIYEPTEQTLHRADSEMSQNAHDTAAAGIVGYVARTGQRVEVQNLATDPRFDPEADAPDGNAHVCFIAEPIFGAGRAPIGVLTACRPRSRGAFSPDEVRGIELLAGSAGLALGPIQLQNQMQDLLLKQAHPDTTSRELFRNEALEHFSKDHDTEGEILRSAPRWLRRTHALMLLMVLGLLLYFGVAKVDERATGTALIRSLSKVSVMATEGGVVRSVNVTRGDHVRKGDIIICLQDIAGKTTAELRAPAEGVISDLRSRPGQPVATGDPLATVVNDAGGYELLVFLPGVYAPQIQEGMTIVLRIDGYPESYEVVPVQHVGSEIISAREALRYAGYDSVSVSGPVVVIQSVLPSRQFSSDGHAYGYRDGLTAIAYVTIRSKPMIESLFPAWKQTLTWGK